MRALLLTTFVAPVLMLGACDTANQASARGKRAAADAVDASKKAVDASKKAVDGAKKWWDDAPDSGELSDKTKAWLAKATDDGEASIEKALADGEQYAPTAVQIAQGLSSAVDSDTGFEPIYVEVDDKASVDEQIGDMPKVQVVDGLTIGLKRVDAWDGLTKNKERGYLVLWREDEHLVGFVYRSRREIDLEKVAAEVPRLVELVRAVTAGKAEPVNEETP